MTFYDRVYGSLAGLALGDALGMPTEFLNPEQIATEFGWVDHPVKAPPWHFHQTMQPGQITDDTGQTLALAHAYTADGKLTAAAVARALLTWADSQGPFLEPVLGPSTKAALEALRRGEDPEKTGANGKTNGASFRAVVIGLMNHTQRKQLIQDVVTACLPTHNGCHFRSNGSGNGSGRGLPGESVTG
jgi:ADP-ribosylglycohydrolase